MKKRQPLRIKGTFGDVLKVAMSSASAPSKVKKRAPKKKAAKRKP